MPLLPPPRAGIALLAIVAATASCVRAPPAAAAAPAAPAIPPAVPAVPVAPPAPAGPGLQVEVRPPDAVLVIDLETHGPVSALPGARVMLKPGVYQISLEKEGYRTWRAEMAIRDALEVVKVELDPE